MNITSHALDYSRSLLGFLVLGDSRGSADGGGHDLSVGQDGGHDAVAAATGWPLVVAASLAFE